MSSLISEIPLTRIERIRVYINTRKLSLAQIVSEEKPDLAITGTFYRSDWTPACHLKGDKKVYADDPSYGSHGYMWDTGPDIRMALLPNAGVAGDNYITCCQLISGGKPSEPLYYNPDVGGRRGRAAIGIKGGSLVLYVAKDGTTAARTPEELRDYLYGMGLESAVMLDGGTKVNFYAGGQILQGAAISQNLLLIYLKKEAEPPAPPSWEDKKKPLICLDAGHGMHTPGKRCMKALDPLETREWVLNSRMADHIQWLLSGYDCDVIRADDPTGEVDITLTGRCAIANNAGADYFISIHHNAGINGGRGGGIVVFAAEKASSQSYELQRAIYEVTVSKTGLKGNRAIPVARSNFTVLTDTKMPAILGEFGFMDSATDVPIILTDDFSSKCAEGIVEALIQVAGLQRKPDPEPAPDLGPVDSAKLYRVQVGAFANKANAERLDTELRTRGYSTIIREE